MSVCLSDRNRKRQSKEQFRDSRREVRRAGYDAASGDSDSKSDEQFVRHMKIGKVRVISANISSNSQKK